MTLLEQHQAGQSEHAVPAQLEVLLRVYHRTTGPLSLAYEPAWAITTGEALHLSKDGQAKRFRARIDAPEKNWKFSLADIHERSYWDTYICVYGAAWAPPVPTTPRGTSYPPTTNTTPD